MTSTYEILKNARSTASYLTLSKIQFDELYRSCREFVGSPASRQLDQGDLYSIHELHFILSLLGGKDDEAKIILTRLTDRFGEKSPRLAILKSLYLEATESTANVLAYVGERPETEVGVLKRKVALSKFTTDTNSSYITGLVNILSNFPSDGETWAELAAAYLQAGLFPQSLFALHEVLLLYPQAYNINALIGETTLQYVTALQNPANSSQAQIEERLIEAVKFFLRSVELCEDYVRGWAGVLVATNRIAAIQKPTTDVSKYVKLYEVAKKQLSKIVGNNDASSNDIEAAKLVLKAY
ncbi:hypothetical protein V1514DRAFT_327413 [Lipomyces japonicus]|uniref:uncharacterized protein n=1 Tax=Lipomyces japonicus TaxID=56871 RepID=UPI0034CF98F0